MTKKGSANGKTPGFNRDGTPDKRYRANRSDKYAGKAAGFATARADASSEGHTPFGDSAGNLRDSGHTEGSARGRRDGGDNGHAGGSSDNGSSAGRNDTGRKRSGFKQRLRDVAGFSDDRADAVTDYEAASSSEERANVRQEAAPGELINPQGKPTGGRTPRAGDAKPITPEAAERLVVTLFGVTASLRRRPWWAINNPQAEVRPWRADLAEVLNSLPIPYVEAAGKMGAGVAVAAGLLALVVPRVQDDAEYNAMPAEYRQAVLQNYGGKMPAPQPQPRTQEPAPMPRAQEPAHSGGAKPATPTHLDGLISTKGFAA